MLLWEALDASRVPPNGHSVVPTAPPIRTVRLPFDKRCSATTRSGSRCRGRIRADSEFCLFHDPAIAAKRRARLAAARNGKRKSLAHLPDGYLRKLTSMAAVGNAMDRLYREVRLGVITPNMGRVMSDILSRILDSGLVQAGPRPDRSKATRLRPKLQKLLTREIREAWKQATTDTARTPTAETDTPARRLYTEETGRMKKAPAGVLAPPLKVAVSV